MNKVLMIAMFLTASFILTTSNSFAENFVYDDGLKLTKVGVEATGVYFTVVQVIKKKKVNMTPNSSCVNNFYISPTTDQYDGMMAFLLAAKTSNKKIGITYDSDWTECNVPVISVVIQ